MKKLCVFLLMLSLGVTTYSQGRIVYVSSVTDWDPDLFWEMTPIPGYTQQITINEPSHLIVQGHIDVRNRIHIIDFNQRDKAIGVAFHVMIVSNGDKVPEFSGVKVPLS